jgi:hypothetical protein
MCTRTARIVRRRARRSAACAAGFISARIAIVRYRRRRRRTRTASLLGIRPGLHDPFEERGGASFTSVIERNWRLRSLAMIQRVASSTCARRQLPHGRRQPRRPGAVELAIARIAVAVGMDGAMLLRLRQRRHVNSVPKGGLLTRLGLLRAREPVPRESQLVNGHSFNPWVLSSLAPSFTICPDPRRWGLPTRNPAIKGYFLNNVQGKAEQFATRQQIATNR